MNLLLSTQITIFGKDVEVENFNNSVMEFNFFLEQLIILIIFLSLNKNI